MKKTVSLLGGVLSLSLLSGCVGAVQSTNSGRLSTGPSLEIRKIWLKDSATVIKMLGKPTKHTKEKNRGANLGRPESDSETLEYTTPDFKVLRLGFTGKPGATPRLASITGVPRNLSDPARALELVGLKGAKSRPTQSGGGDLWGEYVGLLTFTLATADDEAIQARYGVSYGLGRFTGVESAFASQIKVGDLRLQIYGEMGGS